MQSVKRNFNCFLGGLLIVLSALNMLLYFCGYCFVPSNCAALAAAYGVFALISAALSAGYRRVKTKRSGSFGRIMPVILLAFTVSLFFAVDFDGNAVCANIVIIISAVAAALIFFAVSDSVKMKNVIINICVGMIPAALWLWFVLIFSSFGETTVTQTAPSPDGTKEAWVVRSDQGALGGDTFVYARSVDRDLELFCGTFKARDRLLHYGGWGEEYELEWIDDSVLSVGGELYDVG